MNSTPSAKTEQSSLTTDWHYLTKKKISEHFNTSTWVHIKRWNVHRLLWIGKQEHKETHTQAWLEWNTVTAGFVILPKQQRWNIMWKNWSIISPSGWSTKQNNNLISLWLTVSPAVHKESCVMGKKEPLVV